MNPYLFFIISCHQASKSIQDTSSSHVEDGFVDSIDTGDEVVDTGEYNADTAVEDTSLDTSTPQEDPWQDLYLEDAFFKSTHNSYSGEERGTILEQLESGVRGIEFDVHDNDFQNWGDYLIGHSSHGSEVDHHGSNPDTILLKDWLAVVNEWSLENPQHAPITITLDLKDNLTDNHSHTMGGFSAFNQLLLDIFSDRLVPVSSSLPSVADLRGKVMIVISGDEESRKHYKRDKGHNPAVAINDQGQVMEVHDSGTGWLWYWTGQLQPEGDIIWHRHGRYDSGTLPAIALNNDGFFVEVHKSESQNSLWYHTGYLDQDYFPHFSESVEFDSGTTPSIRFEDKNTTFLREIHVSENTGLSWDWYMELNQNNLTLTLGSHNQCSALPFDKEMDGALAVSTESHNQSPADTLVYRYQSGSPNRIRYPQVAFVEYQRNNASEIDDAMCHFAAIGNGQMSQSTLWQQEGKLTRVWSFSEGNTDQPPPNYPAVDYPYENWYIAYCQAIGCLE